MSFYQRNKLEARIRELESKPPPRSIRVAANALVVRDGHALLVEFNDASGPHFNFPGGGVEVGETLEQAVIREVKEETCVDVQVERLLLVVESVGSRNTNLVRRRRVPWNELRFFFLCTPTLDSVKGRLPDQPDANEVAVHWLPLDELPHVEVLPQVSIALLHAMRRDMPTPSIIANPHE